jgi:hypothetical protein
MEPIKTSSIMDKLLLRFCSFSSYINHFFSIIFQKMGNKQNKSQTTLKKDNTTSTNNLNPKEQNNKDELVLLFEKYKELSLKEEEEEEEDIIDGEGMMKMCQDLNIDPNNVQILLLIWKLECEERYRINRNEFLSLKKLGISNFSQLSSCIQQWDDEIKDRANFKKFYNFMFKWNKENPNQKCLSPETAIMVWRLLLKDYKFINEWCDFLEKNYKKGVSMDLWSQFLEFSILVGENLSSYDADAAWHSSIDDFVSTFGQN